MKRVRLYELAHARSGDKGDTVNVGVIARRAQYYDFLREILTSERVKQHFGELVKGAKTGRTKRQYWVRQGSQWKIFFEGTI